MNGTVEYPYADLSGMVVVKNQSGQKLVLDVYGNEIISAGQYEDLAPARWLRMGKTEWPLGLAASTGLYRKQCQRYSAGWMRCTRCNA